VFAFYRRSIGAFIRVCKRSQADMGTSGELIRLINYVDDIVTTLRRIQAFVAGMDADESKRLADSLRAAGVNLNAIVAQLEKGAK
jgi:hypothetical protein